MKRSLRSTRSDPVSIAGSNLLNGESVWERVSDRSARIFGRSREYDCNRLKARARSPWDDYGGGDLSQAYVNSVRASDCSNRDAIDRSRLRWGIYRWIQIDRQCDRFVRCNFPTTVISWLWPSNNFC